MYLSHKYKFIFLRSPKTASSSLSEFFIKNVNDPNAVYTPVDDTKIPGNLDKAIVDKYRKNNKFFHFTLQDLLNENIITNKIIDEYRCFSILRNPIDRQKSAYYFRKKYDKARPPSLEDYKNITKNLTTFQKSPLTGMQQTDLLLVNNEIKGELWLYENLESHVRKFMKDLNIDIKHPLPKHKSGNRKKETDIIFDKQVLDALQKHFSRDFREYKRLVEN